MGRPLWLVWLVVVPSCSPTYSPPIRGLHAGMPGRLGAGELEVSGAAGGWVYPAVGGPALAFGLSDRLLLEAGANLSLLDGYGSKWATGWAGVRLTRRLPLASRLQLVGDIELGAGAGVGGVVRQLPNPWSRLFTYGIYEGFGLGVQWSWFGVYLRGRLDAAAGKQTPTTLWPTAMLGLEVRPARWFSFGLGGGYAGYWNREDRWLNGWFYQAQVGLIFDLLRSQAEEITELRAAAP